MEGKDDSGDIESSNQSGSRPSTEGEDDSESSSDSNGSSTDGGSDGGDIKSFSGLREQLIHACGDGDLSKVKYLVEVRHVDPHSCRDDEHNATPLHFTSECGHLDIVRYLVEERNYNMECRDKYKNTPLHRAAAGGSLDVVQYLISERGCDPMSRGLYGRTPLHRAYDQRGKLNVVKYTYLVEDVKVDPLCQDDEYVATPLHVAIIDGHLPVVKVLVEDYLCDPGVRDKDGETPADWAEIQGHTHIISYLSSIEKTVSSECDFHCGVSMPFPCMVLSFDRLGFVHTRYMIVSCLCLCIIHIWFELCQ